MRFFGLARSTWVARGALGIALIFGTVGCQHHRYAQDADELFAMPRSFSRGSTDKAPREWFYFFNNSRLTSLVRRALSDNLELASAWARLQATEARARQARGPLWPAVRAAGGVNRSEERSIPLGFGGNGFGGSNFGNGEVTRDLTIYDASVAASYEIDLWGRLRKRARAVDLRGKAAWNDLQGLAMTIAASVTRQWLRAIESSAQIALLEEQIVDSQRILELDELRLGLGQGPALNVTQQEQRIEALRGRLSLRRAELARSRNLLATLLGSPPQATRVKTGRKLPKITRRGPTGLPIALLQRRPDLRAAYLRLHAADEETAAAIAARLPSLKLEARFLNNAEKATGITDLLQWMAGATLSDTLISGGREAARIEEADARARRALFDYGEKMLGAMREVEDALANEFRQFEQLASLTGQIAAARRALKLGEASYSRGEVDYQRYLDARISLQDLRQQEIGARRQLLDFRVQLHRALGGRWPRNLRPKPITKP